MNGSDVWGSSAPYGEFWLMVTRVQMEYLQKNEYFPFKTVIIDGSLQNTLTLGEKNAKIHLETF